VHGKYAYMSMHFENRLCEPKKWSVRGVIVM
jgi:hypothetical protein